MAEVSNEEHVFLDTKSGLVGNKIHVDRNMLKSYFFEFRVTKLSGQASKTRLEHTNKFHSDFES